MRAALSNSSRPSARRGVTLVEMLVVVALVVLMMTILVQIFQSATGAMTASKATQELDVVLRQFDLRIKQDLIGCTARFTPPLDPALKLGYFEYGENSFADAQGEDSDDYIAFTTKAPEGQVFTGRVYISPPASSTNPIYFNGAVQPVTVTSQLAEVIYFLRNGNLYRRVLLIAPQRQTSLSNATLFPFPYLITGTGNGVSWQGANDISARPGATGPTGTPIANDLGDLTNRQNRFVRPRFRSDFFNAAGSSQNPDGSDDDLNGDDIPDFYPTLYPAVFTSGLVYEAQTFPSNLTNPPRGSNFTVPDVYPFPYIFPGMYSHPEPGTLGGSSSNGWLHSLDPSGNSRNHNPLFTEDNLAVPDATQATARQTWWGFPTWRETLAPNWLDPVNGLSYANKTPTQQLGLRPYTPDTSPASSSIANNLLPPMDNQFANDGAGSAQFSLFSSTDLGSSSYSHLNGGLPGVWDDDLILTNVRSFDIKAYDPDASVYSNGAFLSSPGYYDLGYGAQGNGSLVSSTPIWTWDSSNNPRGFGHAGRMPPLTTDYRINPSRPINPNPNINASFAPFNNVGDDNAGVIRMTRVWDSWSTDYTNAPDVDVNLNGLAQNYNPAVSYGSGQNQVPINYQPIYPSYPAPYSSPLRGIQIQIRVADPRNEHVKMLTIRQDFTDKL